MNILNNLFIQLIIVFTLALSNSLALQANTNIIYPSKTKIFNPGQKIVGSDYSKMIKPFIIQRLAKDTYWIYVSGYNSTVVIGKKGVMVIDAPRDGRGSRIIKAIRTLTNKPINTLVYSHYHFDHVGDAHAFVDEARLTNTQLRIIGSSAASKQIERYGNKIPQPTEIVSVPRGSFKFENHVIEMGTSSSGHSVDNSWILLKDAGVLHAVDMVHPGAIVFPGFALAEDLLGYENSLKKLLTLDWKILSAGHNDIGSRHDIKLVLNYMQDIRAALGKAMTAVPFMPHIKDGKIFFEWFMDYRDDIVSHAMATLRPKWHFQKAFEVVTPANVEKILWHSYMH